MKSIYFQLVGGAAGDMLLYSLIGLGCPLSYLSKELRKLNIDFSIKIKRNNSGHVSRGHLEFKGDYNYSYRKIVTLIKNSKLENDIKEKSLSTYALLFNTEKKIHGVKGNDFSFHHLGKLDAILEICGFYIALKYLKIDKVYVSSFPLSQPAQATLTLLKSKKINMIDFGYETITPTAAALLNNAIQSDLTFTFEKHSVAYGKCADKDYLVAYIAVQTQNTEHDSVIKIETNIDDMNPQVFESLFEILYSFGAKEVYVEQVIMKKSRPGFVLNVLCVKNEFGKIRDAIFSHTTTFGIRYSQYQRDKLKYNFVSKKTKFGKIKFRVSESPFKKETPEYADCLEAAKKSKIPLLEVYRSMRQV